MKRPITLLNESEVVYFTPLSEGFPACSIHTIFDVERSEARNCLGSDLYESLLGDLKDYSGEPEWVEGTSYLIGDVVLYCGIYYQAIAATNNPPTTESDWEYADKFETAYNNKLWYYLGRYLAVVVLRVETPFRTVKFAAEGMTQAKGDNFEAASDASVKRVQFAIDSWINTRLANLEEYLGKLSDSSNECDENCTGCNSSSCLSKRRNMTNGYDFS